MKRKLYPSLALIAIIASIAGCGGGSPRGTVTIDPRSVNLSPGANQTFSVTVTNCYGTKVDWSVPDIGGGTITNDGVYTAPGDPGTYHVTATCHHDTAIYDTVPVFVQ